MPTGFRQGANTDSHDPSRPIQLDGTNTSARFEIWSPCFHNHHATGGMSTGEHVPDAVAAPGSPGLVPGSVGW